MSNIAISIEGIGKRYRIGVAENQPDNFRGAVMKTLRSPFRYLSTQMRQASEEEIVWALRDIDLSIYHGDVIALVGKNGAGKSTLLKILSRITRPSEGRAVIHGRVGSLLEIGTGFHPDLTGRENTYLNGTILGMRRREITSKMDEIVAFSGIEQFMDTPVKRYSSGMRVRLAFAVAAHLDPEILLIDEVLAVGDADFQKKCIGKMSSVAEEGRTVVFVSHNLATVENLCKRGVVIADGRMVFEGTQTEAIQHYLQTAEMESKTSDLRDRNDRTGTGEIRIVSAELRDTQGTPLNSAASGQDVDIYLHYEKHPDFGDKAAEVTITISTSMGVPVFTQNTEISHTTFKNLPHTGAFVCRIPHLPLPPSAYRLGFRVRSDYIPMDEMHHALDIAVVEGDFFGTGKMLKPEQGVALVAADWKLDA